MDWIGWAFGSVGMLVGVAGVIFGARAEARATKRDRKESLAEPSPPWGDPIFVSGSVWKFRNDGERTVLVTGIVADPVERQGLVRARRELPAEVGLGDSYPVMITGTMAGTPAVFIEWNWKGEKTTYRTRRAVK